MVHASLDPRHDEVNLHRLLRRLEKSVQNPEEWSFGGHEGGLAPGLSARSSKAQLRLKAQKDIQMAKYARKLVHNVESYGYESESVDSYGTLDRDGSKTQELNDVKIRLDRVESSLKDLAQRYAEPPKRPPSLLAQLPKPLPPPAATPQVADSSVRETGQVPAANGGSSAGLELTGSPDNLLLSPPELEGIPSPGFEFDYPPLYSPAVSPAAPALRPGTTAVSSSIASGSNTTQRKPQSAAHASLHEELSSQLESMAAQLKRNAIHFSTNLAKDKSVVEAAGEKLERNYDTMQTEKGRLGRLNKITGGTTWMTLGIVLAVVLLFIVMIGVIRFSRT